MNEIPSNDPPVQKPRPKASDVRPAKVPGLLKSASGPGRWNDDSAFRKLRLFGCSVVLVICGGLMYIAYSTLKGTVWTTYERVRDAVERSVLVNVQEADKGLMLAKIESFDEMLRELDDPYPAMGRFVNEGRRALADGVVDGPEVLELVAFLENETGRTRGD